MSAGKRLLVLWLVLVAGNIVWAFVTDRLSPALDRSYFQGIALLCAWVAVARGRA